MDAREQLLQSLMQDLQNFQMPERFSAEKKAQIEKGRQGQKDIDAGRAAIGENERLYQEAVTQRGQLQDRVSKLQSEIETAGTKAKADSPYEQARQIALFGIPAATGLGAGFLEGRSLTGGLKEKAKERAGNIGNLAESVRSGEIPQSQAASTARNMRLTGSTRHGIGPLAFGTGLAGFGGAQRALAPQLTDNPTGQDVIRGLGGLESGVGTGLALQQIGSMFKGVPQPNARDVAVIAGPQPGTPPLPPPPPEAPALRTPSDRLTSAARAAGATGKLTKTTAAAYLTSANINDANRAAVATELGVGPGQRIASAVKRLSTSRTPSSLIGPIAAAGLAYDATTGDAEAAGATPAEARTKGAVAGTGAAGLTAAGGYGLTKLLEKAPNLARALGLGAGEMAMPVVAMNMGPEDSLQHQQERTAIAQNYPGLARFLGIKDEMAQLPERNMGKTDEYATARGLQIPEGIPSPRPDGSSPYPDLVSAMMASAQPAAAPPPLPSRRLVDAMMQGR